MQDVSHEDCGDPVRPQVHEEHLDRYARLLVEFHAGLRQRQPLFLGGGLIHRSLIRRIARAAREIGAGEIDVDLIDPLHEAQLIASDDRQLIDWYHQRKRRRYLEILRTGGAVIAVTGLEFPDLARGLADNHPRGYGWFQRARLDAYSIFREQVLHPRHCPWVLAAGLHPEWARQVFPETDDNEAYARLASILMGATFADRDNALERAIAHRERLRARQHALDALEIREVQVTGGGNDLRVGLSRSSRWMSAHQTTISGQRFCNNVPSEEVFTSPDPRRTEGRLVASRPFRTGTGLYVEDLVLEFRQGRVVEWDAGEGKAGFAEWLDVDDGARRLGELALVGEDSLLARAGVFFDLPLVDENASSHVALGDAYPSALADGFAARHRNRSSTHTDIMFGSPEVSVVATRSRQGRVMLLDHGRWPQERPGRSS